MEKNRQMKNLNWKQFKKLGKKWKTQIHWKKGDKFETDWKQIIKKSDKLKKIGSN